MKTFYYEVCIDAENEKEALDRLSKGDFDDATLIDVNDEDNDEDD